MMPIDRVITTDVIIQLSTKILEKNKRDVE